MKNDTALFLRQKYQAILQLLVDVRRITRSSIHTRYRCQIVAHCLYIVRQYSFMNATRDIDNDIAIPSVCPGHSGRPTCIKTT